MSSIRESAHGGDFHGLGHPEGVDRKMLYQSSYRTITTYAMPIANLANEFKRRVSASSATMKDDSRTNFEGTGVRAPCPRLFAAPTTDLRRRAPAVDVVMPNETVIHVMMGTCGSHTTICARWNLTTLHK